MGWEDIQRNSKTEMMDRSKNLNRNSNLCGSGSSGRTRTDDSLGILDLDALSGFGESSGSFNSREDHITERLRIQRLKALKTLEKVSELEKSHTSVDYDISTCKSDPNAPKRTVVPGLDRTDYVPYRRNEAINISDLMADHTIDIKSVSSVGTINKISFEPSEITGRSTMCVTGQKSKLVEHRKSVREILPERCADDVNSMSEADSRSTSIRRTVDNIPDITINSIRSNNFKSTFSNCRKADDSEFCEESFTPAEFMNSKLAADEMAWEQQYATIPSLNKSKKLSPGSGGSASREVTSTQSSDFSIGDFFNKRSGNLLEMMPNIRSPTKREAFALVDDSLRSSNKSMLSAARSSSLTPKVDEKTYSLYKQTANSEKVLSPRCTDILDKSYMLSMSAIANALNELGTDYTPTAVFNHFQQVNKANSTRAQAPTKPLANNTRNSNRSEICTKPTLANCTDIVADKNIAEKENWNPSPSPSKRMDLADTATFTESMLDASDSHIKPQLSYVKELRENTKNLLKLPTIQQPKGRKRSHSSTRVDVGNLPDHETPIRRSRSPSSCTELAAASGSTIARTADAIPSTLSSHCEPAISPARSLCSELTMTPSDRMFLIESKSPDCGKYSLPNFGLVSRSSSPLSNVGKPSRSTSQCSSSSEFSHRDGKLPLKASRLEVSWSSVKLRKTVQKSIQIKNTSNKRLIIKAEVSGPGFQIVTTQENGNLMTLQSQECRTIYLSFCPTVIGAAAGQLLFLPPYGTTAAQQIISLFGYGGHASIICQGTSKGPVGSSFLSMGELSQLSSTLEMSFVLYNRGPLTGFACMIVDSIGLDLRRLCDCIEVIPKKVLIPPESRAKVRIIFRPRREDLKIIVKKIQDVMTLANLRIICGDDATRQRIRNLIRQMNDTEKSEVSSSSLSKLWSAFPNEKPAHELDLLKEKSDTALELLSALRTEEIAITLNHSAMDSTIHETFLYSDNEETIMFRTIISDTSLCSNTDDISSKEHGTDSISMHRNNVEWWSVQPSQLEIDPFDKKIRPIFVVRSNFFVKKGFRVDTNFRHILQCTPTKNDIMPGEMVQVAVKLLSNNLPSEQILIMVYVDNEKIALPVNVKKDKFPAHLR